jgi:D-alanyl-D-alanine carboxypeptidase/D-alanyl-D-alanine-endopeptidase (penicillin-binding protein 4)
VPLATGPCGDWRTALRIEPAGAQWRPRGAFPTACRAQTWPLAAADPQAFGERLMADLWRAVGGRLDGRVRSLNGPPTGASALASADVNPASPYRVWRSPPLAQVVRDINKFSNNVMAQQLFLTLGVIAGAGAQTAQDGDETAEPADRSPSASGSQQRVRSGASPAVPPWPVVATPQAARAAMQRWAAQRLGPQAPGELVIDNGSGLSRHTRMTAQWLARMLQHAWSSPVMPEFLASLPVTGVDGTMRRSRAAPGRAHLKTGSLRDVIGRAGYVLDDQGRRHVFVALIQHPNAQAARPALDALVDWSMRAAPVATQQPPAAAQPAPAPPRTAGSTSALRDKNAPSAKNTRNAKNVQGVKSTPGAKTP